MLQNHNEPIYEVGVIIPVYRATMALPQLLDRISDALAGTTWHAYIVDDSGFAPTREFLDRNCRIERVTLLRLKQNSGQQNAVLCGIRAALPFCRSFVTMDDDGQHPPALLPELIAALPKENGLVYAVPERGNSGMRSWGGLARDALFSALFRLPKRVRVGSFRVFTDEVAERAAAFSGSFFYFSAWVLKAGPQLKCIQFKPVQRCYGESGYTLKKLVKLYWGIVFNYLLFPRQQEKQLYEIEAVYEGELEIEEPASFGRRQLSEKRSRPRRAKRNKRYACGLSGKPAGCKNSQQAYSGQHL